MVKSTRCSAEYYNISMSQNGLSCSSVVRRLPQLLSHQHCWAAVCQTPHCLTVSWYSIIPTTTTHLTVDNSGYRRARCYLRNINLAVGNVSAVFDRCTIACVFVLWYNNCIVGSSVSAWFHFSQCRWLSCGYFLAANCWVRLPIKLWITLETHRNHVQGNLVLNSL